MSLPEFSIKRFVHSDESDEKVFVKANDSSPEVANLLAHYGITRELIEPIDGFENLYSNVARATSNEIESVVRKIIPRYGGYELQRIGGEGDGGYLIPDDLAGIEACFSPGVNNSKSFEDHLTSVYGIKAFMCDYTSDATKLHTPLIAGKQFFDKKWLDVVCNENNNDINKWVEDNTSVGSDLLLQMDIEGAEYRNLLHASLATLSRFRILVIEFHGLNDLCDVRFLHGVFEPTITKITSLFTCVHAHANNCCGSTEFRQDLRIPKLIELTFLRNDRLRVDNIPVVLPHALDANNVRANPPLQLEGLWLQNADLTASEISGLKHKAAWLETSCRELGWRLEYMNRELNLCARQLAHFGAKTLHVDNNVARGKRARQSSLSEWSTSEGANGAINGFKTGSYGIHTLCEPNPWWMVDLEGVFDISEIRIFNRLDACSDRVSTLKVSVSLDASSWTYVYDHAGRPPFGGVKMLNGIPALLITLDAIQARFAKVELTDTCYLHLDEVEIYKAS